MPPKQLLTPGGKTALSGLSILDDGRARPIAEISPLAKSLAARRMFDWALLVSCPASDRDIVSKSGRRILLG